MSVEEAVNWSAREHCTQEVTVVLLANAAEEVFEGVTRGQLSAICKLLNTPWLQGVTGPGGHAFYTE